MKAHVALNDALAANDMAAVEALTGADCVMVATDGVERARTDAAIRRTVLVDALRAVTTGY